MEQKAIADEALRKWGAIAEAELATEQLVQYDHRPV